VEYCFYATSFIGFFIVCVLVRSSDSCISSTRYQLFNLLMCWLFFWLINQGWFFSVTVVSCTRASPLLMLSIEFPRISSTLHNIFCIIASIFLTLVSVHNHCSFSFSFYCLNSCKVLSAVSLQSAPPFSFSMKHSLEKEAINRRWKPSLILSILK
jgi:hypothetical protein